MGPEALGYQLTRVTESQAAGSSDDKGSSSVSGEAERCRYHLQ